MLALGEIVRVELPSLGWVPQASLEARFLLLLRDVQVKFENDYVILREVLLEGVNLPLARLDPVRRHQPVNTGHQHIFIMRSVEDAGHPGWRHDFVDAPQEIMRQLVRRWFLKLVATAPN